MPVPLIHLIFVAFKITVNYSFVECSDGLQPLKAFKKKAKTCVFFCSTDAVVLSFLLFSSLVCDPQLVAVGCLQVWASCMSLSPFLFMVFLGRASAAEAVRLDDGVHRSGLGERNTQIKIVFCLLESNPAEWNFFSGNVNYFSFYEAPPFFPLPKGRWLYLCIRLHLGLYLPSPSSSDVSLGTEIIELCQSKHEIIQKKSPSLIFSCLPLRKVTANLNCWQHGDRIAW